MISAPQLRGGRDDPAVQAIPVKVVDKIVFNHSLSIISLAINADVAKFVRSGVKNGNCHIDLQTLTSYLPAPACVNDEADDRIVSAADVTRIPPWISLTCKYRFIRNM